MQRLFEDTGATTEKGTSRKGTKSKHRQGSCVDCGAIIAWSNDALAHIAIICADCYPTRCDAYNWRNNLKDRMNKHEYWMAMAELVSRRATCPRATCGAVLVDTDGYLVSSGYNGAPSGMEHCHDVGCQLENDHCQRAIHAEMNAIAQAAIRGVSVRGCVMYVYSDYRTVCKECMKLIRACGVHVMEK